MLSSTDHTPAVDSQEDAAERAINAAAVYFLIRLVYVLLFVNALILVGVGAILGMLMRALIVPLPPLGGP